MLRYYFETRAKFLEEYLKKTMNYEKEQPSRLFQAIKYSIFSGGKKLRPVLFFATYEMIKNTNSLDVIRPLLPIAASLEMVHTASLIHDDLPAIDNSNERRGLPSCHRKFDPATAILAGDALLTKAFEMITYYEDKATAVDVIQILCESISTRGMIGGQTVDVLSANKTVLPLSTLRYIHTKKTGALLEAAVKMACRCANVQHPLTNTLTQYAGNIGLAYQIIDDILDDVGDFETLGKEAYEDVRNSKTTYPTIIGLDKARKMADKLLVDSYKLIKNMKNNENLLEFVNMIQDRLP